MLPTENTETEVKVGEYKQFFAWVPNRLRLSYKKIAHFPCPV